MAINLLSDVQCKNATSEGKSIRKLPDGVACICGFILMAVNTGV